MKRIFVLNYPENADPAFVAEVLSRLDAEKSIAIPKGWTVKELPMLDLPSPPLSTTTKTVGFTPEVLERSINSLQLSVRAHNCLASAKIFTVGQLLQRSERQLLQIRSFGKTALREVKRAMADLQVTLPANGEYVPA